MEREEGEGNWFTNFPLEGLIMNRNVQSSANLLLYQQICDAYTESNYNRDVREQIDQYLREADMSDQIVVGDTNKRVSMSE